MENKDEIMLQEVSAILVGKLNDTFAEGFTEENIEKAKEVTEKEYLEHLPEEYHKKYMPVLAIRDEYLPGEDNLFLAWRDISHFINRL